MPSDNVLFVDDEEFVLHSIRRTLISTPFNKLFARSAFEAEEYLREQPIQVVVADIKMPVEDGVTFLSNIKDRYPNSIRIAMSGYSQITQIIAAINRGEIFRYIPKPWEDSGELLDIVQAGLAEWHRQEEIRRSLQRAEDLEKQLQKLAVLVKTLQTPIRKCRHCQRVLTGSSEHWQHFTDFLNHLIPLHIQETICPQCKR